MVEQKQTHLYLLPPFEDDPTAPIPQARNGDGLTIMPDSVKPVDTTPTLTLVGAPRRMAEFVGASVKPIIDGIPPEIASKEQPNKPLAPVRELFPSEGEDK